MYFIIFFFGLLIGSFINVCIYRIPKGERISYPPSHCSLCNERIKPIDLIPVISFIFLKGRCRKCREKISIRYPLVELLLGFVFLLTYIRFAYTYNTLSYITLLTSLVLVTFIDIDHRIIPNKVNLFILITGIIFTCFGLTTSYLDSILGFIVGGGSLYIISLFSLIFLKKEGIGGGDIKLMAVCGIYLGAKKIIISLLLGVYLAAIFIVILLIFKKLNKKSQLAFGPFLSLGMALTTLYYEEIIYIYTKIVLP